MFDVSIEFLHEAPHHMLVPLLGCSEQSCTAIMQSADVGAQFS
jgi:hypothetical protein